MIDRAFGGVCRDLLSDRILSKETRGGVLMSLKDLEATVERMTGMKAEQLRRQTITEGRLAAEKKAGRPMQFRSEWPFVGRGNVLRDRILTRDEINRSLDKALRG